MSNESITCLSDATKATMRNSAMVAGYMALLVHSVVLATVNFSGSSPIEVLGGNLLTFKAVISSVLIICGIALAFLHKRDLVAIMFMMFSAMIIISPLCSAIFDTTTMVRLPILLVMLFVSIAMLFTGNEQKYICGLLLIPMTVLQLRGLLQGDVTTIGIGDAIVAVISAYCVICIGLENPKFPGYKLLTADESDESKDGSPVHFKISGSVLGYAMMMTVLLSAVLYKCGVSGFTVQLINANELCCGIMLIIAGFIMLAAGRMKFTPFMFMMVGTVFAIAPSISSIVSIVCLFLIVIGILCIFRKDRRIIVGICMILMGLRYLFVDTGICPSPTAALAVSAIALVLLAYVSLGLMSNGKVKLI